MTLEQADGSLLQAFGTADLLILAASGPRVLLRTAFEEDFQEMKPHAAA